MKVSIEPNDSDMHRMLRSSIDSSIMSDPLLSQFRGKRSIEEIESQIATLMNNPADIRKLIAFAVAFALYARGE